MARGNNQNRGRGGFRGSSRGDQLGGRGGGRGRGRGYGPLESGGGRGRGGYRAVDEFDLPVQMWPDNNPPTRGGTTTPRGRSRGRSFDFDSGYNSPVPGRGTDSARGRGRGRGRGDSGYSTPYAAARGRGSRARGYFNSKLRSGVPLSKLLNEDRPLLKPIVFVRSVYTATLFQEEEDILQPLSEPVADDERSHVPTADQVARVFSRENEDGSDDAASDEEERLEEIDFADVGKTQAEVDATVIALKAEGKKPGDEQSNVSAVEETFTGFYVDTTPAAVVDQPADDTTMVGRLGGVLGEELQDDEEIIVYVAPHPRTGRAMPSPPAPIAGSVQIFATNSVVTGMGLPDTGQVEDTTRKMPSETLTTETFSATTVEAVSESTTNSITTDVELPDVQHGADTGMKVQSESSGAISEIPIFPPSFDSLSFSFDSTPRKKQPRKLFPVGGPRSLLKRSMKARRRSLRHFSSYGAALSEAHLQEEAREKDTRESEQRRGDSDVNWGDSSSDQDVAAGHEVDDLSNGMSAMELDSEDISLEAMKSFAKSMSAEGSRHVTMDDIADGERMRAEDDDQADESAGSAGDDDTSNESGDEGLELVVDAEERLLVGEDDSKDDDEDEDMSSDEEATPRSNFQARLAKLRANTKGKQKAIRQDDSSSEDFATRAHEDDEFFAGIEEILDQNAHILAGRDRKAKTRLFRAISDGDFDDDEFDSMMKPAPRRKDKYNSFPLQDQWEKDREKKAENKRKRAKAILEAAADPLAQHKGGKKGRKAMLAAARLDVTVELPNRVTDLASLEQQIRRFIADIGGRSTMTLPPANKDTRTKIHELANAFNLKSQSKGNGKSRYTTLIKTTKSGIGINEKKIRAILKRSTNSWDVPNGGRDNGKKISLAKHREGEEVGKAAPKIGESNVGFKLLAAMGWTEGDRIGLSGGLDAPLTAVMKKTKLGLGATL